MKNMILMKIDAGPIFYVLTVVQGERKTRHERLCALRVGCAHCVRTCKMCESTDEEGELQDDVALLFDEMEALKPCCHKVRDQCFTYMDDFSRKAAVHDAHMMRQEKTMESEAIALNRAIKCAEITDRLLQRTSEGAKSEMNEARALSHELSTPLQDNLRSSESWSEARLGEMESRISLHLLWEQEAFGHRNEEWLEQHREHDKALRVQESHARNNARFQDRLQQETEAMKHRMTQLEAKTESLSLRLAQVSKGHGSLQDRYSSIVHEVQHSIQQCTESTTSPARPARQSIPQGRKSDIP